MSLSSQSRGLAGGLETVQVFAGGRLETLANLACKFIHVRVRVGVGVGVGVRVRVGAPGKLLTLEILVMSRL